MQTGRIKMAFVRNETKPDNQFRYDEVRYERRAYENAETNQMNTTNNNPVGVYLLDSNSEVFGVYKNQIQACCSDFEL